MSWRLGSLYSFAAALWLGLAILGTRDAWVTLSHTHGTRGGGVAVVVVAGIPLLFGVWIGVKVLRFRADGAKCAKRPAIALIAVGLPILLFLVVAAAY
jgi:hypothetical protein